jgi:hypothetical protein
MDDEVGVPGKVSHTRVDLGEGDTCWHGYNFTRPVNCS